MAMVDDFVDFIFLVFAAVFALLFIYMALNTVTSQSKTVSVQLVEEVQIKRDLMHSLQPPLVSDILNNNEAGFHAQAEKFFTEVKENKIPNDDGLMAEPLGMFILTSEDRKHFEKTGSFDKYVMRFPKPSRLDVFTNFCYRPGKDEVYSFVELQSLQGNPLFIYYCSYGKSRKTKTEKVIQGLPGVSDE